MPAMMRGADGRYLALTRRQFDTIRKACVPGPGEATSITPGKKSISSVLPSLIKAVEVAPMADAVESCTA